MPLGTEVNVGSGDVVLDGAAGAHPQFSVDVYYGQTAVWMKTPLCTEVDLSNRHCIRWCPSSSRKALFSAHVYCGHGRPVSATAELL